MKILNSIEIAKVWAGHPVGFDLLTYDQHQFIVFYGANRQMEIVAQRIDSISFEQATFPSYIGWDSHNYVTMAIDDAAQIHLCGNMHGDPLTYFRTTQPLNIQSFAQIDHMTGQNEGRCTYPVFMRGSENELIFRYRDGSSGNGVDYYNVYDPTTEKWKPLIGRPLLDGKGLMNAYSHGPIMGRDKLFHLVWMWRDTPDCRTNHHISYARSQDLRKWETGQGEEIELPITIDEKRVVVDPIPVDGGMINMNQSLGFDHQNRPIVSYHKHDAEGKTQIYNARLEGHQWQIYQVTNWDYRWDFKGNGSISAKIRVGAVHLELDGSLVQSYSHVEMGSGGWQLNPDTLEPVETFCRQADSLPLEITEVRGDFPGLTVQTRRDRGQNLSEHYLLRWETLSRNRDRPRDAVPPASQLTLYALSKD
ncbi:MAG: BNR repeat-containing protein [Candidatus Poribacteria bacterium]|nr:BNR repeat-containing protein [Candidatus Poribacteria bacterium]